MRVEFYFSRKRRTHKNFQLFIKLLLKIKFVANFLFRLVHSKLVIFIPSMRFLLNYYQNNPVYAFSIKILVKYLFD